MLYLLLYIAYNETIYIFICIYIFIYLSIDIYLETYSSKTIGNQAPESKMLAIWLFHGQIRASAAAEPLPMADGGGAGPSFSVVMDLSNGTP